MSTYTQKQFIAEAKSGMIHKCYYIYGTDTAEVIKTSNLLLEYILGKDYQTYVQKYNGNSAAFDLSELSDKVQMYPFGCEYNCILVNDWNCEKRKADENKKIQDIIKNDLSKPSVLIFNVTGFDVCDGKTKPSAKNKKLIDLIDKNGAVALCNIKTEAELSRDIVSYVKSKKCTISSGNAARIAHDCLCQSELIYNELDKVCSYVVSGEITGEVIDKLVTKQESMKIYAFAAALISANTERIMHDYRVLCDEMEIEQILFYLSDTFITWYRARAASIVGVNASQVQSDFGYRFAFIVTNAFRDSKRFSLDVLRKCIIILKNTQKKINTSSKINKNIAVEQALVKIISVMKGVRR